MIDLTIRRDGMGVIWINSSHEDLRYVREAERSAKSVRVHLTTPEFVLVTDQVQEKLSSVFDFQAIAPFHVPNVLASKIHYNGQIAAKLATLQRLTWGKNLYLGSDVIALRPGIEDVLVLLDKFDVVIAHAPVRVFSRTEADPRLGSLPYGFPEMNCDLIGFRRNDAVRAVLTEWHSTYIANAIDHPHDQGAFRYLLYHSALRVCILPPEYNFRGFSYSPDAVVLQRREMNATYASHYPHLASVLLS